jgi:hypothetical protein
MIAPCFYSTWRWSWGSRGGVPPGFLYVIDIFTLVGVRQGIEVSLGFLFALEGLLQLRWDLDHPRLQVFLDGYGYLGADILANPVPDYLANPKTWKGVLICK